MKIHCLNLEITPKAQARHRDAKYGKYKIDPSATYKQTLKYLMLAQRADGKILKLIDAPVVVDIMFFMPIPRSTSKVKREAMLRPWRGHPCMPHVKKPDADNLEKAVWDAMTGIILQDDSQIFGHSTYKYYSEKPYIHIEIYEYEELKKC